MDIVIACGAMNFGPNTLDTQSLGGSETAALMLGKALAARGHKVSIFCNLPPRERPDYWPGGKADDGVVYVDLQHYQAFAAQAYTDLTIIVRDPNLAAMPSMTKKKVLWMHDIATKRGMQRAFDQMQWSFDEVWTVSEWHRQQVHSVTGFPLTHIRALRNGIVPMTTMQGPRIPNQLVYAARPERGLDNLICPGGIMEHLPEYNLVVCMYAHFPEHMRGYYEQIFKRMNNMPNVQFLGPKPQRELRQIMRDSAGYIYPTQFEETSCIIARECIEQKTPFLTTKTGALPETLGTCGLFFEDWYKSHPDFDAVFEPIGEMPPVATPQWHKAFADFVRASLNDVPMLHDLTMRMSGRSDLYWDDVAVMVEANAAPKPVTNYSRAYSLMQDGDVIAARELLAVSHGDGPLKDWSPGELKLWREITANYPFLLSQDHPSYKSQRDYYEWVYEHKKETTESELVFRTDALNPRIAAVMQEVEKLPAGARIAEYGCGPGHLLAALAVRFPDKQFHGVEISQAAVDVLNAGARERNITNLAAERGDEADMHGVNYRTFDAVIVSEVLEHVQEPWVTAQVAEMMCKIGGRMIITTPFGSWEQATIRQPGRWHERAHIWHLDAKALMKMFGHKKNLSLIALPVGSDAYNRPIGNTLCAFDVSGEPEEIVALNPLEKAFEHHSRQTVAACVIAMNNEDTILRMLESIQDQVQMLHVALGPSSDNTLRIILDWADRHPWIAVHVTDAPKIEPRQFGFDDARNLSASYSYIRDYDWFIWIDTDEYLSGNFLPYLRNSCLTGYIIPQHHFTVEPRGGQPQIDRPARLLRTDAGYKCVGRIHEHFQLGEDVGRCYMLPNVDLGHVGYTNEAVRKDRFRRNFAFLEWDHDEPPGGKHRKLHHFLWFRDIVHRVRLLINAGDMDAARKLAAEGEEYYNTHWKDMLTFGHGLHMGLAYISEIRNYLAKGIALKIAIALDDKQVQLEGRFSDYAEVERFAKVLLDEEFKDRASRYY